MVECNKCENKPCCKDRIMSVELSLDFLFRLAKKLGIKPEDVFNKYCEIQAEYYGGSSYIAKIGLQSPCPFLKDACDIHSIKPLMCIAFPASSSLENPLLYANYPCKNGTLEGVSNNEINFFKEIIPIIDSAQILSDNVYFKTDRPRIDLRDIRNDFLEIDEYCKWLEGKIKIENETIDERDKRQLVVNKIASEQINKKISKETVFIRIRMIKPEIKTKIQEINNNYFNIRLNHDT
jgi:Fe-S-cluster containining protein